MLRALFATSLVILGTGRASSQQPAPKDATPTCSFSEVYKKDGWAVPWVQGAKVKQRGKTANMPGVFVGILEPANVETNIPEIWCPQNQPGRLAIDDAPVKILRLWSFDLGGKVFAYRIEYANEAIDNGVRQELASASCVFFYDMDGSGNLTLIDGGKKPNGS